MKSLLGARFVAAALLVWQASEACASTVAAPSGTLQAGQTITVEWSGLPPGVEELEVLLSLDVTGGQTLRLTRELDPAPGSVRLRLPNLPVAGARIILRVGVEGEEEERELACASTLSIVALPGAPLEPIAFRRGEWWSRSQGPITELPTGSFGGPVETIGNVPDEGDLFLPRSPAVHEPPRESRGAGQFSSTSPAHPSPSALFLSPVRPPLRN